MNKEKKNKKKNKKNRMPNKNTKSESSTQKLNLLRRSSRYENKGIKKPAIKRLARRGGVKRISEDVYLLIREILVVFLEKIINDAIVYSDHSNRKTISHVDILKALKRVDKNLYGYK